MIEHFSPGNEYTMELCDQLCHYVDITLLCRTSASATGRRINQKACLYAGGNKNKLRAVFQYCRGLLALYRELSSEKYQIVHVQTFQRAKLEIPIYRKMRHRIGKLVHTVHNVLPHEIQKRDKELYGGFYQDCDILIVHNAQSKKQLIELFGIKEQKVLIIPHGVYRVKRRLNMNKIHKKTHYLLFGAIRQYKGIDILLHAVSMIPRELRSDMELVIAGKQYVRLDKTDYLQMIKDFEINDCVRFMQRRVDDKELSALLEWADVCVFPYREIYGSGALLMAYAYQKPVIVSDVPAFVEETCNGRTGLIFRNEDASSLSDALLKFSHLEEDNIKTMVSTIKELVDGKYNWTLLAKMTVAAYNKTVD